MVTALVLAFLVGWPSGGHVPGQTGGAIGSSGSKPSYHWVQPSPAPGTQSYPFYGNIVGPRETVCRPAEWFYIGNVRAWYPGVCWSRRAYLRMP